MRVAWLYPSSGLLDGQIQDLARIRGADVFTFRVHADPKASLPVASLGELDRLGRAAAQTRVVRPDVVAWACTAGSFLAGADQADAQRATLAEAASCPSTTTSHAITWAVQQLRASDVLLLTPYTEQVGSALCGYLEAKGFQVVAQAHAGHATDEAISAMSARDILELLPPRGDYAGAECVVLPCTALRSEQAVGAVTAHTGLPAVTASMATMEHAVYTACTDGFEGGMTS